MSSKKGWKYKIRQNVFLKGSKGTGLPMKHIISRQDVPWGEVTGKITDLEGSYGRPGYSVLIAPRWQYLFLYASFLFLEEDIYIEGEASNIEYLDRRLFEL